MADELTIIIEQVFQDYPLKDILYRLSVEVERQAETTGETLTENYATDSQNPELENLIENLEQMSVHLEKAAKMAERLEL
jgi:hypothetical protein